MEKMKKCKACGKDIAKSAKVCPSCGKKYGLPTIVKILIVLVVIFGCIVGCMNGCSNAVNDAVNEYKDINGKSSFKINETFQNKFTKVTMVEVNTNWTGYNEYLKPGAGNKIVAIKFEVENIGDSDEEVISTYDFNMTADGVVCEKYYWSGNDYATLNATIGKGNKAIGWVFFEVPTGAQKINVNYNPSFFDGNAVEFIVAE